jgi:hypothetical protein
MYRLLKTHERIPERGKQVHRPLKRPAPMSSWQLDFKDVSSVPADPEASGNTSSKPRALIDSGTSVLLDAHVRSDFTAETALEARSLTLRTYGRPQCIRLDRDARWVGSPKAQRFSCRQARALERVWASRSTSAIPIIPSKTPL